MRNKNKYIVSGLLTCLLLLAPLFAHADDGKKDGIIVWRLQAKEGVTEKNIDSLSGYLTSEVARHSGRSVVSEADVQTVLRGEEKKQKCGVDENVCLAEIGGALGVPEAVAGDLGRVGDIWILNLRRINVREVKVLKRSSRQARGSITSVVEALSEAVMELFESELKESKKMSDYELAAYSTFFPGLAMVAVGGIGSWQWQVAADDADAARRKNEDESDAMSRMDTWTGVSAAMYAIGGAAMVTGAVLWIIDPGVEGKEENDAVAVDFGPVPTPEGFGVGVYGRF